MSRSLLDWVSLYFLFLRWYSHQHSLPNVQPSDTDDSDDGTSSAPGANLAGSSPVLAGSSPVSPSSSAAPGSSDQQGSPLPIIWPPTYQSSTPGNSVSNVCNSQFSKNLPFVKVQIQGQDVTALVDSGSALTLLHADKFLSLKLPKLQPTSQTISGVTGSVLALLGSIHFLIP